MFSSPHSQSSIPIINITSPQVVIETANTGSSVVCMTDPQIASGHIIQPEHGLQDDPIVEVNGKFKEHLLNQDSTSDATPPMKAKEHSIQVDVGQEEPKKKPEHTIIECLDGTSSPRLAVAEGSKVTLFINEDPEYTTISLDNDCVEQVQTTRNSQDACHLTHDTDGEGTGREYRI